jgi:hypothetical protein
MSPAIEGIRNEPDKAQHRLIITDQQRYDTIAALGYPHAVTPNLDRLVREGTHFESCYITAPIMRAITCQSLHGSLSS